MVMGKGQGLAGCALRTPLGALVGPQGPSVPRGAHLGLRQSHFSK